MERPTSLIAELAASIQWPDPQPDGSTHLSASDAHAVQLLIGALANYIEIQLSRCLVEPPQ